jgi:hypothetical protein
VDEVFFKRNVCQVYAFSFLEPVGVAGRHLR